MKKTLGTIKLKQTVLQWSFRTDKNLIEPENLTAY